MTCGRCNECLEKGYDFCIYCGESLVRNECDQCQADREKGYTYCTKCGSRLVGYPQTYSSTNMSALKLFLNIGMIAGCVVSVLYLGLLLFEYGVALWGIPTVFPKLANVSAGVIIVVPSIITLFRISGITLQIFYILLVITVGLCIAVCALKSCPSVKKAISGDRDSMWDNPWFETAALFGALYFIEIVFFLILESMGVDISSPVEGEDWELMYSLIDASVWEEVITRILYLGVPMLIVALITKKKDVPLWKYPLGGFGMNKWAVVFIFFSAFMFGAGHLGSWALWKFFPTFVFGLMTGYLFAKHGVYTTILFHFLTDYMMAEKWLVGSNGVTTLILIITMIACIPFVGYYAAKAFRGLKKIFERSEQVP